LLQREPVPALLLLEMLLRKNQPFMPERFVDPHGVVNTDVGIMRRRFYTSFS